MNKMNKRIIRVGKLISYIYKSSRFYRKENNKKVFEIPTNLFQNKKMQHKTKLNSST